MRDNVLAALESKLVTYESAGLTELAERQKAAIADRKKAAKAAAADEAPKPPKVAKKAAKATKRTTPKKKA